jgi:uncharacterized protein involved in exopolysaccharide biosynthesis/Mrp family chromosome partitioning ATPase
MANPLVAEHSGGPIGPANVMPPDYVTYAANTERLSMRDIVRLFERHRLMIMLLVGLTTLGVLIHQLLSPTLYRSIANVQVEVIDQVGNNQADITSRNQLRVANAVRLYRSRSAVARLIKDLDLFNSEEFRAELGGRELNGRADKQAAINKLLQMISVTAEEGSDLIEIAVTSRSPTLAAEIANQFPSSVRAVKYTKSDERRRQLLASLMAEKDRRAIAAQEAAKKVADFRAENRMLMGAGGEEDLSQINRVAVAAAAASAARAGSAARSAGVSAAAGMRSTAQASSPALQQLQRQQAELIAEQARLSSTYGPNHPDMVRVNSEMETVRNAMEQERSVAIAAAQDVAQAEGAQMAQLARSAAADDAARAGQLQGYVSSLTSAAYRNSSNSVKLEQLVRDSRLADKAYTDIAERGELVRAQMQLEGVSSSIVSPAVPNFDPIAPTPIKSVMVAFLGSGIIALLLALAIDFLDDRLRNAGQIRRLFGLPTFGMLPNIAGGIRGDIEHSPVIQEPQSLFAEAARSAFSEVRALHALPGAQSILVTSPLPGDGKSTVSLTLAAAGIALGERVVVLDLDLRKRGMLQQVQDELDSIDIVDVITGKADLNKLLSGLDRDKLIAPGAERQPQDEPQRIVLLSATKPVVDPAAILTARRLTKLLNDLRGHFDLIVVNAPAALAVRDARAMCDFSDQTIVVTRWGRTTIDQMRATLELLGDQVAGVVFDSVDYAEHARRRYGDSVQFYVESSEYYTDEVPARITIMRQLKRLFAWRPLSSA